MLFKSTSLAFECELFTKRRTPPETTKIESSTRTVNGSKKLIIVVKLFIVDVWSAGVLAKPLDEN